MEKIPNQYELELESKRREILAKLKSGRGGSMKEYFEKDPDLWNNRGFSLDVLACEPWLLAQATESLKNDPEAVATACLVDPTVMEVASDGLKPHRDFIVRLAKNINFRNTAYTGIDAFLIDIGISDPVSRKNIKDLVKS